MCSPSEIESAEAFALGAQLTGEVTVEVDLSGATVEEGAQRVIDGVYSATVLGLAVPRVLIRGVMCGDEEVDFIRLLVDEDFSALRPPLLEALGSADLHLFSVDLQDISVAQVESGALRNVKKISSLIADGEDIGEHRRSPIANAVWSQIPIDLIRIVDSEAFNHLFCPDGRECGFARDLKIALVSKMGSQSITKSMKKGCVFPHTLRFLYMHGCHKKTVGELAAMAPHHLLVSATGSLDADT